MASESLMDRKPSTGSPSFRHDGDELMAEHGAHDGQSGAGVSARELDHRLARLKLARCDGVLDDLPGNAVLLREPRV